MTLWDWAPAYDGRSHRERYEQWRATPDGKTVYEAIRAAALRLHARGFTHYGMHALCEAARFNYALRVGPDVEGWKINNNYSAYLARELMEREPALEGMFELRELKAP